MRLTGKRMYLSDWNTDPREQPFEQRATPEDIKKAQKEQDGFSADLSRMDVPHQSALHRGRRACADARPGVSDGRALAIRALADTLRDVPTV